jgi:hypothetical protein
VLHFVINVLIFWSFRFNKIFNSLNPFAMFKIKKAVVFPKIRATAQALSTSLVTLKDDNDGGGGGSSNDGGYIWAG